MANRYAKSCEFPDDVASLVDALGNELGASELSPTAEAWFEKNATAATPMMVMRMLWRFTRAINAKNVERNSRLALIEARLDSLEKRPPREE